MGRRVFHAHATRVKTRFQCLLVFEVYGNTPVANHWKVETTVLFLLQESFFRDLHSESSGDEDSGVEEPTAFHPAGRRRSVVSFNLSPSLGEAQSTDVDGDSENEDIMYLPTNVRSIEETFDAWHESFKRPESRTSMFSSGGGGSPNLHTPQIMEEDESFETRSSSSCFSAQESDTTGSNNARPVSRLSFVSSEKTVSPEPSSRVSSANSGSVYLETMSQVGLNQEGSNVWDQESERNGDLHGADEMTRSLSSVLSFITEHGQVKGNSSPSESFVDEPDLAEQGDAMWSEHSKENATNTEKKDSVVESESITEQEDFLSREGVEENGINTRKKASVVESEPVTEHEHLFSRGFVEENRTDTDKKESIIECESTSGGAVENSLTKAALSELDMRKSESGMTKEPLIPVIEVQIDCNDGDAKEIPDEGTVPSISVEITCSDDEEDVLDKGTALNDASVDSSSVADSISEENVKSGPIKARHEEVSETTEDFSNADERSSISDAVDYSRPVEGNLGRNEERRGILVKQKDEVKPTGSDEDCLHCKHSKRKNSFPTSGVDVSLEESNSLNNEDLKQSIIVDLGSDTERTASVDEYSGWKSAESESIAEEKENVGTSTSVELDPDSQLRNEPSAFPNPEDDDGDERETPAREDDSESQDSQGEPFAGKEQDEDDDDEAGYTTEASVTTLQGIRGVLGARKRSSTAATSIGFDVGDESAFSEDGSEIEDKPYDLATKQGFDAFREFLLETSGEKLLQFWLEVECGKYLENDDERSRCLLYCSCFTHKFHSLKESLQGFHFLCHPLYGKTRRIP